MKKKIISIAVIAIAIGAAWSVNQSNREVKLTDVITENVEALASKKPPVSAECWYTDGDYDCSSKGAQGCACI